MKKQVLIVIDSLGCGGAEKSLAALLNRLDYSRMDVDLLVRSRGGVNEAHVPECVRMLDYRPRGIKARLGAAAYSIGFRLLDAAGVRRHRAETLWALAGWSFPRLRRHYDVAIAYQQGVPTFFAATKVSATRRLAWINVDIATAGYRPGFCGKYYDRYDKVVAVSRMLHESIRVAGYTDSRRLTTIYDIVDTDEIRSLACLPAKVRPLPAEVLRIVTVGRMERQKNYILAVEAAAELKRRGVRFVWHFVGDGSERPTVAAAAKRLGVADRIVFEGARANPYPWFAAADIYVQTSSFEGFGLTLAEARVLGKPVVTTDFGVARDQIADGHNGLIAQMTPASVADKIEALAADPELRRHIAANAAAESNDTAMTESRKVNQLICEP
ncbi:MAG: glycosyltransferase [Muribaculaceae bacterium]|nr:glycosyltransferase [Muribaculaceae bacterium]